MPSFEVEFEVICATCGYGLCNQSNGINTKRFPTVEVEVCPQCIENAIEKARNEGYEKAKAEIESAA